MRTIYTQVIVDITAWIESNLGGDLSVKAIAKHSGYSPWHLQRIFKDQNGIALATYVRQRRLEMAKLELIEKNTKILDIAIKYGYSSQQDFTRVFKRMIGHPPATFRRDYSKFFKH